MADQGKGRQRQCLVEHEEGEEIAGKGDTDRRCDGDGKEGEEPGLVRLVVTAHVADRIDRRDDPQAARHEREGDAQRLDGELEREAGDRLRDDQFGNRAAVPGDDGQNDEEDRAAGKTQPFPDVGPAVSREDGPGGDERHDKGERQHQSCHGAPPRSRAAVSATPTVRSVETPRTIQSAHRTTAGINSMAGASSLAPGGGFVK